MSGPIRKIKFYDREEVEDPAFNYVIIEYRHDHQVNLTLALLDGGELYCSRARRFLVDEPFGSK